MSARHHIEQLLQAAGIEINGREPWDFQVRDERVFRRIVAQGTLGAGEAYMDGWWDSDRLDELVCRLLRADLENRLQHNFSALFTFLKESLMNLARLRPFQIGHAHYDAGNDLFQAMLDRRLTYTCGYWKDASTLDEAQEAKLDLVCRKLAIKPGEQILDIGSGWGSFINFAAERFGARCVGLTVSKEQMEYANAHRYNDQVETLLKDYLDMEGRFDHVVSLGMFEHVGIKNYRRYMRKVRSLLKNDGLFLLHTIGKNSYTLSSDAWFSKYIFPNSMIPSYRQVASAASGTFVLEDWHNFGVYYDTTLMHWWNNFNGSWDQLKGNYDERFYRMWKFYLLVSAGAFRARRNNLWQIVLSPNGVAGGYHRVS